jgi:hypothetical protein
VLTVLLPSVPAAGQAAELLAPPPLRAPLLAASPSWLPSAARAVMTAPVLVLLTAR